MKKFPTDRIYQQECEVPDVPMRSVVDNFSVVDREYQISTVSEIPENFLKFGSKAQFCPGIGVSEHLLSCDFIKLIILC